MDKPEAYPTGRYNRGLIRGDVPGRLGLAQFYFHRDFGASGRR